MTIENHVTLTEELIAKSKLNIITRANERLIRNLEASLADEGINISVSPGVNLNPVVFMHILTSDYLDNGCGFDIILGNYKGRIKIMRYGEIYCYSEDPSIQYLAEWLQTVVSMYRAIKLAEQKV